MKKRTAGTVSPPPAMPPPGSRQLAGQGSARARGAGGSAAGPRSGYELNPDRQRPFGRFALSQSMFEKGIPEWREA